MGFLLIFNQSSSCKQLPSHMTHYTLCHFFIDCRRRTNTIPRCSSPLLPPKYIIIIIMKEKSSLPISTEAPCHIILKFTKFYFLAPFFWGTFSVSGGYYPLFETPLWHGGLTTSLSPNVSTTFPDSFFMVMPKGLTIGPKSRLDRSCHIKIFYILHS